ncbi:cupredoxin domain-containing protein [Amaricoccus macauensis]|uniref:cupredoxin domain-containing protein n=1 Tax=Amaricoccus macauensis TaxID=57001 RepID=UPI003C7984C9
MKSLVLTLGLALLPAVALAAGEHAGGHGEMPGHVDGGGHGHGMAIGEPAHGSPSRTVKVTMREDYEGEEIYIFEPDELNFEAGETVRLHIVNAGEEAHEFVMDTMAANAEHKELMERFPEMEHDDPNAVRLEPGEEADIVWTFATPGTFEFACLLPGHYDAGMHGPLTVN